MKMKREAGKVFFASALGAGIGALVALEIVTWLWWIGLLVGGLVGYLYYEFKAVLAALPKAWRAACGWQAPPFFWHAFGLAALCVASFFGDLFVSAVVVAVLVQGWLGVNIVIASLADVGLSLAVLTLIFSLLLGGFLLFEDRRNLDEKTLRELKGCVYRIAPPILFFYRLPRGLWWIIRRIPRALVVVAVGIGRGLVAFARFVPRFAWQVFIRIHSERRLICGVDAALGAAAGYFAGSALIGAAVGGLFGVVNFALVTERWLRPRGYLPVRNT